MEKISKSVIVAIMVIAMILSGITMVNAADTTVGMSLTSDSKLKAGETVTVNVNFTQSNSEGIGSIKSALNYDSNVLEYVSAQGQSDWTTVYTATTKILGIERNNFTTKTGTIATITFKVKENVTATSTKVSLNITELGLTEAVSLNPSVTINADTTATGEETKAETPSTTTETPANTTKPENTTTQKPANTVKQNNTTKDNTTVSKSTTNKTTLPKAGETSTVAVVATVAVIAIAGTLFYVRYINLKKYVK